MVKEAAHKELARAIDQQIAELKRERDAAREAGREEVLCLLSRELQDDLREMFREQPTDTAEGGGA